MKQKNIFSAVLIACITVFSFISCNDDDPNPESRVSWKIAFPEVADNAQVVDMKVVFTNINTKSEYTGQFATKAATNSVSIAMENDGIAITATIPEGLYKILAEGKINYMIDSAFTVATIRAYQEAVTVSDVEFKMQDETFSFYTPSQGFVFEEIYFTGSTTPENKQYSADQYFKIFNNSDQILYADGLAIAESEFMTIDKQDYSPDIMNQSFSADFIFVIPGNGTEHPVEPGKSLVIALQGSNHLEANPNSIDLSHADFEFYDVTNNDKFPDVQNPAVPDLDKWYSSTFTYTSLHNRGFKSYVLAKMQIDKETYLKDYFYTATYEFKFNGQVFPMSKDTYHIPNSWIVDAVNCSIESDFQWLVTDPSLDAGWTHCGKVDHDKNRYNKSVRRKIRAVENGRTILEDTNNSTNDFEADAEPSLKKR